MPKQPLRTNQIVSKLKAASSPVVHGTATNAIDALQLSLDSPTPISAWVCQTTEGEKSLSVIDLGSSTYLGLDIDPKLGYINCYLASGAIIGKGDRGNQIKGPLFHFLSREDVNDTATQLINAGESKEIVNPNPSGSATATLEKLQVGETIYGISASDVYEYTLSAAETAQLLAGLGGTGPFEASLNIDYTEALKHPAIRLVAEADVDLDHIKLETFLVEIGQAYSNGAIVKVSYQSAKPMGLTDSSQFDLNLIVVDGNPILDGTPHASGGGSTLYFHNIRITQNNNTNWVGGFTLITTSNTAFTESTLASYLYTKGITEHAKGICFYMGYDGGGNGPRVERFYSGNGTTLYSYHTMYSPSISGGSLVINNTSSAEQMKFVSDTVFEI